MSPTPPRIAVTGPERGGFVPWIVTALALRRAGARPRRVTPRRPPARGFDALVLGGGSDVDPRLYGERRRTAPSRRLAATPFALVRRLVKGLFRVGAQELDPRRDEMEIRLLRRAVARRLPVLGICRGMQLINVFFGGDLHQDLLGYDLLRGQGNGILPRKLVAIAGDSRLGRFLGTTRCRVNSLHNQAVREVGNGLRIVARDRRGVVQAVEHRELSVLGVQWHPEYLPQKPRQQGIFRGLAAAAAADRPTGRSL